MEHLRVPPPPPPPHKPIGTRPKAAPKLQDVKDEADTFQCGVVWPSAGPGHWTDRAGDSRRLNRPKDERVAGDRSGASSSSTAPRLLPNESAPAPFNDKTHDHKWEIVPALNSGDKLKIQIARCASSVAKHEGLADNKGTLCFYAFMDLLEAELAERLGPDYEPCPDWRMRWWQIIQGCDSIRFKFCLLHSQSQHRL